MGEYADPLFCELVLGAALFCEFVSVITAVAKKDSSPPSFATTISG
jgi:hypothetical protein